MRVDAEAIYAADKRLQAWHRSNPVGAQTNDVKDVRADVDSNDRQVHSAQVRCSGHGILPLGSQVKGSAAQPAASGEQPVHPISGPR